MSQFSDSVFQDSRQEPSFLSRLGIALVLVTAGVGLAMIMAAG